MSTVTGVICAKSGMKDIALTYRLVFQEGRYAVIHVPLQYYPFFLQPVLRLLFGEDHDDDAHKIPWPYRHHFLNLSITPVECSVVCSRHLADRFFIPLVDQFNAAVRQSEDVDPVQISDEDFHVVQVDGQGLHAGQRVLELTYPLALAGISILFETTYFSDYILVPQKSIHLVVQTLEERGFSFSSSVSAYVSQHSPTSPRSSLCPRPVSAGNPFDFSPESLASTTAPCWNIKDLQRRTFARLNQGGTTPTVDPTIRLVSCAGRREAPPSLDASLQSDLLQILVATCPGGSSGPGKVEAPNFSSRFLSLTLTSDEPISLLLETCLLFHPLLSLSSALLYSRSSPGISVSTLAARSHGEAEGRGRVDEAVGQASRSKGENGDDVLIPITLDLRDVPLEATGIVCGVAGRLAQGSDLATLGPAPSSNASDGHALSLSVPAMTEPKARSMDGDSIPPSSKSNPLSVSTSGKGMTRRTMIAKISTELSESHIDDIRGQGGSDRNQRHYDQARTKQDEDDRIRETHVQPGDDDDKAEAADEPLALDISFLSTARAGTVIVRESDLKQAVRALELELARGREWTM